MGSSAAHPVDGGLAALVRGAWGDATGAFLGEGDWESLVQGSQVGSLRDSG